MAREGLLYGLRSAIDEAGRTHREARATDLRVRVNHEIKAVDIVAIPLTGVGESNHFLVVFEEAGSAERQVAGSATAPAPATTPADESERVRALKKELADTRSYLESIIQDLEAANEELQSANEEVLASNEELQSTNEELDTAKEELQSNNEELTTVNDELQARNEDLRSVNSDLENLLTNVQVPVAIVDGALRVRRYTPAAAAVLNLIPGDVGRPIDQIRPDVSCENLSELMTTAIERLSPIEQEVQDTTGRWYAMWIRPYKDTTDRIDGAVLTLFDIDSQKREAGAVQAARDFAEAILDTIGQPIVVLDERLAVRMLNPAFCEAFGVDRKTAAGEHFYRLKGGEWDIPQLRRLLEEILPTDTRFERYTIEHDYSGLGRKRFLLSGRRLEVNPEAPATSESLILLIMEDVTERS